MKILTLTKPSPDAVALPVNLYVSSAAQSQPAVQITVPHYFEENTNHVSHLHVTDKFITVSKYGSPTVGISADDLVRILYEAFPEIHWLPVFEHQPQTKLLMAQGETLMLTVKVNSYKDVSLQWQQFDGKDWQDCGGFTDKTFTTKAPGEYRCMAKNARGESVSDVFHIQEIKLK